MHRIIISISLLLFSDNLLCQDYQVSAYHEDYVEIEDYNSLQLEVLGVLGWSNQFELDFSFPFFDLELNTIECSNGGLCHVENQIDFSMRLLTFGCEWDLLLDTAMIDSDVRFKLTDHDGKRALVLQFTNMRLLSDMSIEEFDSYINYQLWFLEDGTIRVKFGKSNLENSTVYIPGEGFYLNTGNASLIPIAQEVALFHPFDETRKVHYDDLTSYEDYQVLYGEEGFGSLDYWPEEGWVIEFQNKLTSTNSLREEAPKIYPNPSNDIIRIDSNSDINKIEIYSVNGGKQLEEIYNSSVDISTLESGMYFLKIYSENELFTVRIIRQ